MGLLFGIVIGLFVLIFLVAVHELGHAVVARRNGVVVKEFGIGFPPKAFSKKIKKSWLGKDVEYSWNWLPLGGFVRLKGEYDSADKKGDYGAAGYWAKTKILFAGVAINWLVAALLLTVLAWVGLPKILQNQFTVPGDTKVVTVQPAEIAIVKIKEGSAAYEAGLKPGDIVRSVGQQTIRSNSQVAEALQGQGGKAVPITVVRGGESHTVTAQIEKPQSGEPVVLGVSIAESRAREVLYASWSAPIVGIGTTVQLTGATLQGLGDMVVKLTTGVADRFSGDEAVRKQGNEKIDEVTNGVAGPVGILGVIFPEMSQAGIRATVFLVAIISLSLAVMNALPIPALDGGRWAVMTIFKLRKKVLTREKEESIQAIGMLILLGLILLITIADIGKVLR